MQGKGSSCSIRCCDACGCPRCCSCCCCCSSSSQQHQYYENRNSLRSGSTSRLEKKLRLFETAVSLLLRLLTLRLLVMAVLPQLVPLLHVLLQCIFLRRRRHQCHCCPFHISPHSVITNSTATLYVCATACATADAAALTVSLLEDVLQL